MAYLVREEKVVIYAFVIMPNHFHLIWRMLGGNEVENVQRDFLKYTAQRILMTLRNEKASLLMELLVNARDRKYQVWERNSLNVPLWSPTVWKQKINYIHKNPVSAGLCQSPAAYRYSSANQYLNNSLEWDFLTRFK